MLLLQKVSIKSSQIFHIPSFYRILQSPNALSPTTQKCIFEKNVRKVAQLKEELQNEITEKNDLLEENTSLKNSVESLNKKLQLKAQENEKLKLDFEDLQLTYEKTSEKLSSRGSSQNDIILNNLKSEIAEYKKYVADLEKENETSKRSLEKCQQQYSRIVCKYATLERLHEELNSAFTINVEKLEELQKTCHFIRIELSDLKECNQTLKEENMKLEAQRSTNNVNSECLERELQFQFMKDKMERMTNNLKTIEDEQMKLISTNVDLTKEKMELVEKQQLLLKEKEDAKIQNEKLSEKINSLKGENKSCQILIQNLDIKVKEAEELFQDRDQRLVVLSAEFKAVKEKLLYEKNEFQRKYDELIKNNHQLILKVEEVINEKEKYQISLQENKTKLEAIEIEYEVLMKKNAELTSDRNNLKDLLQKTKSDRDSLQSSKVEIESELVQKSGLIDDLQAQLISSTKQCETLQSENKNLTQSLTDVNNNLQTLRKETSKLVTNLESTKTENTKIIKENESLVQSNLNLSEKINVHASLNEELKIQLENTIMELEKVTLERNKLVSEYENLKENDRKLIEVLRGKSREIESKHAQLLESYQKNLNVIQNLQTQIQDLLCSKDSLSKELQDCEIKYINLMKDFHEKLDAASHKYDALSARNEVLQKENTNLQSRLCELWKEKDSFQELVTTLKKKIDDLTISKNCVLEELKKVEINRANDIYKFEEQIKCTKLELESLNVKNQKLEKNNAALHSEVSLMADQENTLRKQIDSLTEEKTVLFNNHNEQITMIDKLENQVQNLSDLNEKLSSGLQHSKTIYEKQLAALQQQMNCIVTDRDELEQQLELSKKERNTLLNNNDKLSKKIDEFEKQIEEFHSTNFHLTKELENNRISFEEQRAELQKNLNRALHDYDEQRQNNSAVINENLNLTNQVTEIEQKNKCLLKEIEKIKEDGDFLSQENEKNQRKIQSLELEIQNEVKSKSNLSEELQQSEYNLREKVNSLQNELNVTHLDCKLQIEKGIHLTEENITLQTRISEILTEEQFLRGQLEILEKEKTIAVNLNDTYQNTIEKLQHEIKDLVSFKNSLVESMQKADAVNAEKLRAINQQLETLLHEKKLCDENNVDLLEKNGQLQNKITELQKQEQELQLLIEKYKEEKIILLDNDAKNLNTLQELEKKIENLSSSNDLLVEKLRTNELINANNLDKLEKQLTLISEERECLRKNSSLLVEKNNLLQKDSDDAQLQLRELREEKTKSLNDLREMFLHQINQLQKANDEIREENNMLVEKNAEKLLCLKEVEKRFELLTQDMNNLKIKCKELEVLNETLQHEVEECKKSEINFQRENASLKELNHHLEQEKENLSKQIEVLTNAEKSLNNNFQDLLREAEEAKLNQKELKEVITIESDTNACLKNVNFDLLRKIDCLETEREKLQNEINELSHNVELISQERRNEFQKLQQENGKLKTRLEELASQKEELYRMEKINKEVFENQLQSLMTKNQSLQSDADQLRNVIENMDADTVSLRKKIQHSESTIDDLRRSAKETNIISQQLEEEKQRNEHLVSVYETRLREENDLKKSLESKLQCLETHEIEALKKRIEELKTKLEEMVEVNECLTADSNSKTSQHEILKKENENLMHQINQLGKQKMNIEKECDQLLEEKEESRKSNEDMRMQIKNLSELLENKEKDIVRLKDEYDVFKQEYHKLVQHKGELDKEFKETLLQENAKLSTKCDELTTSNTDIMEQLTEKLKLIDSLQSEIDKVNLQNLTAAGKFDLNETRVVASGLDNEIYMNLRQENIKLIQERDNYKKQLSEITHFLEKEKETYRNKAQNLYNKISSKMITEYEGKLERAKAEYQKIMRQKYSMQESDWKKREEEYKLMLKKEKEHIRYLSTQMWDISDKYLQLKQKLETKNSPLKLRTYSEEILFSPSTLSRRTKSASQLNLLGNKGYRISEFDRRLSTMSEDIPPQIRRRQTLTISGKKFSLPSAKVFPTEDEEQELFDNACLADLKHGRISIDDSSDFSKQRLSILQQRNLLCPPHLKSSYPAETQFIPPQEFKENDIKMGLASENDISDIENLIPRESRESIRKNRNQTSYKKPGPPTPSKNGGRTIQAEHHETPRNVLKEANDNGTTRRKSFTPKFFNNLFALRGHATVTIPQDENMSTTPRHNRLSSIRRRFSKNPQECGNTNSGFC